MVLQMSSDVSWPDNDTILSRIAELDVVDLAPTPGERRRLIQAWIEAAGTRWRASRDGWTSGVWRVA